MGKLKIEYVKPGLVLASDVKDPQGLILLRAGNQIVEKNIRIFKMWGITEINVRDVGKNCVEDKSMEQINPSLIKEAKKQSKILFRHTDLRNAATKELYRLCTKRIVYQNSMEQVNEE